MAGKYDAWYDSPEGKPLYRSELKCIQDMTAHCLPPLLEIGVGTGRFAMHFLGSVGIDPALTPLKMAKTRGVKTVQAYGESLPFADETFRCVLLILTLCFVDDPLRALAEVKRVLKSDGAMIIGFVPKDSPWGTYYEEKKRKGSPFYIRARFHTFKDVKRLLRDTGLKIEKIRSTLMQRPEESARIEEPVEGYVQEAGFLCVTASRQGAFSLENPLFLSC